MFNGNGLKLLSAMVFIFLFIVLGQRATAEETKTITNSLDMEMVLIEAGNYECGSNAGDFDEKPIHTVIISKPFYMGATPVTNAQYEQYDPKHRELRGKVGLSKDDNEAVLFVSWHDAVGFCEWLSKKEGKSYRLPTEAEWEYACRAGTTTAFNTGDELPELYQRHQEKEWDPVPLSLEVGTTPPNAWGLRDMHGLVDEWCLDWYCPYIPESQTDPVGCASGISKVTRGGSHSVEVFYLRSANRSGALPDDKQWLIGFRVVQAVMPNALPQPVQEPPLWAQNVQQDKYDWPALTEPDKPFFKEPISFVNIPPDSNGPLFSHHNHCPDIMALPNGDLFATWYTCNEEQGRELAVAAARFRRNAEAWDAPALFFKVPDRNMHATSVFWDRNSDRLYHFQGNSISYGWGSLALFLRTSNDNGATWSAPHWMNREHGLRNMPIAGVIKTATGVLVVPCDAVTGGNGGSTIHVSSDNGETWTESGAGTPPPDFVDGGTGGTIAGIHAGVVELSDGRLMALGRGDSINDHMPKSISTDMGKTWTYSASPFPPISGGQRLVLIRLSEGPILFVSFTDPRTLRKKKGLKFTDADGNEFTGTGMYAALSYDDGETWPVRKLLTPGEGAYDGGGHTKQFTATITSAEHGGYLAATQSPDNVIHLISSKLHYRFNLAWLTMPPKR